MIMVIIPSGATASTLGRHGRARTPTMLATAFLGSANQLHGSYMAIAASDDPRATSGRHLGHRSGGLRMGGGRHALLHTVRWCVARDAERNHSTTALVGFSIEAQP